MKKEMEKFESEVKSGNTNGILYKEDSEMEGIIRMAFLKEKYGEERIDQILIDNKVSILDLSIDGVFNQICQIAES